VGGRNEPGMTVMLPQGRNMKIRKTTQTANNNPQTNNLDFPTLLLPAKSSPPRQCVLKERLH
jgi:hypothetical protein